LLFVPASRFLEVLEAEAAAGGHRKLEVSGGMKGQALLPGLEREEAAAGSKAVLD
jgi:hypothetical protein